MAHSNNPQINKFWQAYSDRSALKIKQIGNEMGLDPSWLDAKAGNETLEFQVGQKVITTGKGAIKAGIELTIEQAFIVNGFARYYAGGVYHHSGDLQ